MKRISMLCLVAALLTASCEEERFEPPPATPVQTEVARRVAFSPAITLLGVVRAAQSVPLKAPQRGTIRYPAKFANGLVTGAAVSRGEAIATIENDDVRSAQTEARLEMDAAAADFERAERSFRLGVISSAEHAALRVRATLAKERYNAAEKRVGTLRLTSPAAGTLVVTHVYPPGSVIDTATDLGEVATKGAPLVESAVAASQRAVLKPGLRVTFTARGVPAWTGAGHITEVAAVVNQTGTSRVVAAIDGATSPAPGTGVEVAVQLEARGSVLTVPEDAVVASADGPALFVAASAEGSSARFRVKRIAVVTGGRANGRIEITSGLRDGERVVISGVDALTDDAIASEANPKASS